MFPCFLACNQSPEQQNENNNPKQNEKTIETETRTQNEWTVASARCGGVTLDGFRWLRQWLVSGLVQQQTRRDGQF